MTAAAGQGTSEPSDEADWAQVMAEVARSVQASHPDPEEAAATLTSGAVQLLSAADFACVTVAHRDGTIATLGATDPTAAAINSVQQQAGEGPCLTALWEDPLVEVPDLIAANRWPMYSQAAQTLGIRSVLAIRLYLEGTALGALSLYARSAQAFNEETVAAAQVYAAHAAVALDGATERQQLHIAIDSRDLIGQAKGILMERYQLTGAQAFSMLVKTSQNQNIPLRTIVDRLTTTGELPG